MFLAETFRNIVSVSMQYQITKFHLTTNFLCIIIILTIHKCHYFKILKGQYVIKYLCNTIYEQNSNFVCSFSQGC